MKLPRIGPRETAYQNRYQVIYRVEAQFDGFDKEYFVIDTGIKAGIVVVRDKSVLLVRQYRLLINGLSWEIPGGRVNENEDPKTAAIRECVEETGVRCIDAHPLIFYQQGLDTISNPTHIFYSDSIDDNLELNAIDPQEAAGSEWIPLARCMEMITSQKIIDSFTILSLMTYQNYIASRMST